MIPLRVLRRRMIPLLMASAAASPAVAQTGNGAAPQTLPGLDNYSLPSSQPTPTPAPTPVIAPLPTPAERLSRARRMLRSDQVEGAVAQLSTLPGAVRASGWYDHARRYILARRALDVLERSALTRPLPPPPAAATDLPTPTP